MAVTFAMYTTHPGLLRCQLTRLRGQLELRGEGKIDAVGVGTFAQDQVLLRRFSNEHLPATLEELAPEPSEALVYQAQRLLPAQSAEEHTQPLRFRQWLFAFSGSVPEFGRIRQAISPVVPDYLLRNVGVETEGEAAFSLFLAGLREIGRIDDFALDPRVGAEVLGKAARALSRHSAEAGASRASSLSLIATNARVLLGARLGEAPLRYTLLEGTDRCELCGISPGAPEVKPNVRAHRRSRTVALASEVRSDRWIALQSGQALAVDAAAEPRLVEF
jgi:hypothetical protein